MLPRATPSRVLTLALTDRSVSSRDKSDRHINTDPLPSEILLTLGMDNVTTAGKKDELIIVT